MEAMRKTFIIDQDKKTFFSELLISFILFVVARQISKFFLPEDLYWVYFELITIISVLPFYLLFIKLLRKFQKK